MVLSYKTSTLTFSFLLHNFGVQITPFKLEEKEGIIKGRN